jgi:predicted dehydrogenase
VTLRFGTLGAARITPSALLKPAREHNAVAVTAVAARDKARAQQWAAKHDIATVHTSYADLIADPDIDAIYNPLPNGLHGVWTIKALEAGKHVLCEKPFTANAAEAEAVAQVAAAHPELVVMEAFHWRYHPLAESLRAIIAGGELGEVRRVDTMMCIPLPLRNDIRFRFDLAGGSVMDVGCYAIHMNRAMAQPVTEHEPTVVRATAKTLKREPQIDRWITADLTYANGPIGSITAALWSGQLLRVGLRVTGSEGQLRCFNPTQPALFHRATVRTKAGNRNVNSDDKRQTYWHQLDAFVAAVDGDASRNLTGVGDAVANMRVIDAVYEAAGLSLRTPSA